MWVIECNLYMKSLMDYLTMIIIPLHEKVTRYAKEAAREYIFHYFESVSVKAGSGIALVYLNSECLYT